MASSQFFFESEWFGQGKHYGTLKIPEYVSQAKLAMPEAIKATIPPDSMPLMEFLELALSRKSSEFIPIKNQQFFSKKSPQTDITATLASRPIMIPADQYLLALENGLGQSWFDGYKSVG